MQVWKQYTRSYARLYWIVRGRQQVKRVLHRCIPCNRLQSRPFNELSPPIPTERVRKAMAIPPMWCRFCWAYILQAIQVRYQRRAGYTYTSWPRSSSAIRRRPSPGRRAARDNRIGGGWYPDRINSSGSASHSIWRKIWYAKSLHLPIYLRLY